MAEQHRATSEQWSRIERMRHHTEFSAILELLHRVEALEAATQPAKPKPDSSLVERVACAIYPDGSGDGFREEAREAIREVAAWLREHFLQGFDPHSAGGWAMRLEREAER